MGSPPPLDAVPAEEAAAAEDDCTIGVDVAAGSDELTVTALEGGVLDDAPVEDGRTTVLEAVVAELAVEAAPDVAVDDVAVDDVAVDDVAVDDVAVDDVAADDVAVDDVAVDDVAVDDVAVDVPPVDEDEWEDVAVDDVIPALDARLLDVLEDDGNVLVACWPPLEPPTELSLQAPSTHASVPPQSSLVSQGLSGTGRQADVTATSSQSVSLPLSGEGPSTT